MYTARARGLLQKIDRRVPDQVPPITGAAYQIIRALWALAFFFAVIGPLMGMYARYITEETNSSLVLGSRAGIAVSPKDATQVRFVVGLLARTAGIRKGDSIVAVDRVPLREKMPVTEDALESAGDDPDYQVMTELLFGADSRQVPLTLSSPDGLRRDVTIHTGEQHIDNAARELSFSPKLLSFIDLAPALVYPLLLWVAFVLYARNAQRPLPVLLSFSILLTLATEQPSATFISDLGLPRALHVAIYDVGNILLLSAILLFPDARLRPRNTLVALSLLPVMFFLQGTAYQAMFVLALVIGLSAFVRRLRTESGAGAQQLKFLLIGLAMFPTFRAISVALDLLKYQASSLSEQLWLEMSAGVALAFATVALFLVLFGALRTHRLYDADALFSRSAMIAAITLTITGFFAVTSALLESAANQVFGGSAGPWPSLIAAAAAVLLIKPAQRRIHGWSERQFQRGIFELRTELPKRMDDLRETASPSALFSEALGRIMAALRATRSAAVVDGKVILSIGISAAEVRRWLASEQPQPTCNVNCDRSDATFPVRLTLSSGIGNYAGYILLGPRPDGSIQSRDERAALIEIAEPVARAVEVARQRQQAVEADRRWKSRLAKRVRETEDRLTTLLSDARQPSDG